MDGINPATPAIEPKAAEPNADLSKTTLVVLVLLTLVISVIGTWSVLNEVNSVKATQEAAGTKTAEVSLNLVAPAQPSKATGQVVFNLEKQ